MYWWDHAAEIADAQGHALRRFGLVTTNSISQVFQRRVMERHLRGKEADFAGDGDSRSSVDKGDTGCGGGADRDDRCASWCDAWNSAKGRS